MTTGAALPADVAANPRLSTWVRVGPEGTLEVRVGKVEIGQGILTALAQVAADGLGVRIDQVRMLPAHTDLGPDEGITAGSMSVVHAAPALRVVCADVRSRFAHEAARRLGVDADQLVVEAGAFGLPGAGEGVTYWELAEAVDLDVEATSGPSSAPAPAHLVGSSVPRLDLPDKVAGRPRYICDLRLPDQMFGLVVRPPSVGARLVEVAPSPADDMDVHVVRDGSFIGLVAAEESVAAAAFDHLRDACRWEEDELLPDEDELVAFLRAGPHETVTVVDEPSEGTAGQRLTAEYSKPFLAHASMSPSAGVARWETDGRLSVWSHSQGIHRLRDAIAQALGLDATTVTVEHAENAGCYGHNAADDAAFDAVLLARAVPGRPVQVRWSRHDELAWAPFGSAMSAAVAADLDASGRVRSWTYDVWSQGHTSRPGYAGVPGLLAGAHLATPLSHPAAVDPPLSGGAGTTRNAVPLYDVGARSIRGHRLLTSPIRSSALRSLGAYLNVFAIESFMDELAQAAGADPLAFRLAHLSDPRARAVVELAAAAAGWGRELPEGRGLGLGFARYKDNGAYCAVVAEVDAGHEIQVRRLTIGVDVGRVVNPDGVRNQIEGGAVQSTSWTVKERVRFDRRRVTSDDWETYPILRFTETPEVDVHLVDRPDLPSVGAGEGAQGPTAAAIANAVAAALGVRVRDLPLTAEAVVAAIESDDG